MYTTGLWNYSSMRYFHPKRTWTAKFRDAACGIYQSCYQQSSYLVHFAATLLVVTGGVVVEMDTVRWCLLILCVATVFGAEMFNTSLETLAKVVTEETDERIARTLNIASGAVLTVAIGAALVGVILFVERILQWW